MAQAIYPAPWPTASCCGEPRVSPAVDRCYDHAKACSDCGQPSTDGTPASCHFCPDAAAFAKDHGEDA